MINKEDETTIKDCMQILINESCNYQRTALQLRAVLKRNNILEM